MDALIHAINTTSIIDHHAHNLLLSSDVDDHDFMAATVRYTSQGNSSPFLLPYESSDMSKEFSAPKTCLATLKSSRKSNADSEIVKSEATGPALKFASSTLSHLRALKQLSEVLKCEPNWETVKGALRMKRKEPGNAWARKCFQGIETVLMDDGLDPSSVFPYDWHDQLTRSKCKRIVRIEKVAENIMTDQLEQYRGRAPRKHIEIREQIMSRFTAAIEEAISDPEVAGFKSVICYRVGLKIPAFNDDASVVPLSVEDLERLSRRLEDERLNPDLVHLTAKVIERSGSKKPFQFHTGVRMKSRARSHELGIDPSCSSSETMSTTPQDNVSRSHSFTNLFGSIDLGLSNPSHLQPFIESYPEVRIVLLHASYPFTREAGYLASVYKNCWLDIGEVFPMVSQYGQEKVIEQALELCPSEKLTWSTGQFSYHSDFQSVEKLIVDAVCREDGHWFPETYLLAVIQIREGLRRVLGTCIERGSLTSTEAVKIVQDILFHTANQLYELELPLVPITSTVLSDISPSKASWTKNLARLQPFLDQEPSVQFLRLQWLDYTNTLRLRILPIKQALRMFSEGRFVGIVEAVLGILQPDIICPGFSATDEYIMYPQFAGTCTLGSLDPSVHFKGNC